MIIEVHDDPAIAQSDGKQAISLDDLRELTVAAKGIVALDGRVLSVESAQTISPASTSKEPIQ